MGLLGNGWNDPQSSANMALAAGLLNGNFGAGLLGANNAYAQSKNDAIKQRLLEAQIAETQAQAQERQAQARKQQEAIEQAARMRQGIPGLFQSPGMTGGNPQPQNEGGVPMFSRPMGVSPMQATPGGFDVQGAIRLGMDPEMIAKYAGLSNLNRQEVARTLEVDDGRGGKATRQFDKYGQPVGDSLPGYIPPVQVSQGDRVTFARPTPGASFPVNMSPSERDSSARGWNTLAETRRHNGVSESGARVPAGYRMNPDGSMAAIPGGPADLRAGAEGQKKVGDAKDVLGLLDEVDKLLPKATGSYLGAGVDQAARVFGASTDGADATAQLKALQGALIGKMPKMSGPQSDKDVQLYREMAGQVADSTLPVSQRQKASEAIRRLNEKYAGMPEGSSTPRPTIVDSLPKTAPKGARARDTTTGDILEFDGMSWRKAR